MKMIKKCECCGVEFSTTDNRTVMCADCFLGNENTEEEKSMLEESPEMFDEEAGIDD